MWANRQLFQVMNQLKRLQGFVRATMSQRCPTAAVRVAVSLCSPRLAYAPAPGCFTAQWIVYVPVATALEPYAAVPTTTDLMVVVVATVNGPAYGVPLVAEGVEPSVV